MARAAIAVNDLDANEAIEATATNIDATNHHSLTADNVDDLILVVHNTTVSEKDVTILAGTSSAALRSEIGALIVPITASETRYIRLETARFLQADGTISVDIEAAMTGTLYAINPKGSH